MDTLLKKLGFEQVGMRPDMEFTCDFCEEFEYFTNESGESSWVGMFKGPDKKVYCEYCLRRMTVGL